MSKSILVKDTPNSCSECELYGFCVCSDRTTDESWNNFNQYTERHPQCPLQDTTELLENIKYLFKMAYYDDYEFGETNQSKRILKALGGIDE